MSERTHQPLPHTRRRLLTTAAAGAGAVALAACGTSGTPAKEAPTKLSGTLEFWHWGTSYVDGFDKLIVAHNLEALERAGLKPPSELGTQWDWNTFADYAKRLTPGDGRTS